MSRLRILMLSDFYPPDIGGAQRQTQLLSHELQQRGHELNVATVWQTGQPELADDAGVPVHRLKSLATRVPWFSRDPRRRQHPPFADPAIVYGLRRVINQVRPDVVHSYGWISYSSAVALFGKRIPMVISARTYGYTCAITSLLHHGETCSGPAPMKCLECASSFHKSKAKGAVAVAGVWSGKALLRQQITGVHSISTFVQGTIDRDLLGKRKKVEMLIPSFRESVERQAPNPAFVQQLPTTPYILFVGALTPHKGLDLLLAAYQQLEAPPPLLLIGTVRSDTPKQFPAGVTVIHDVPHRDVMAAWERCLFGVSPSRWPEPFGSVIHEAMSQGKAMIGTYPGGHTDMIADGESGLLVPSGDQEALRAAMQRLLDSPALREQLGAAARVRADIFTANVMVPRFEALYHEAIAQEPRVRGQGSGVRGQGLGR